MSNASLGRPSFLYVRCDGDSRRGSRSRARSSLGSTASEVETSESPGSSSSGPSDGALDRDVALFLHSLSENKRKSAEKSSRSDSYGNRHSKSRDQRDGHVRDESTGSRSRTTSGSQEESCKYCDTFQNERQYFLWRSQYTRSSYCSRCAEERPYISYWGRPSYENGSWRKRLREGRSVDIDLTPLIEVLHRIDSIDTSMGRPKDYAVGTKTENIYTDSNNNKKEDEPETERYRQYPDRNNNKKVAESEKPRYKQYSTSGHVKTSEKVEECENSDEDRSVSRIRYTRARDYTMTNEVDANVELRETNSQGNNYTRLDDTENLTQSDDTKESDSNVVGEDDFDGPTELIEDLSTITEECEQSQRADAQGSRKSSLANLDCRNALDNNGNEKCNINKGEYEYKRESCNVDNDNLHRQERDLSTLSFFDNETYKTSKTELQSEQVKSFPLVPKIEITESRKSSSEVETFASVRDIISRIESTSKTGFDKSFKPSKAHVQLNDDSSPSKSNSKLHDVKDNVKGNNVESRVHSFSETPNNAFQNINKRRPSLKKTGHKSERKKSVSNVNLCSNIETRDDSTKQKRELEESKPSQKIVEGVPSESKMGSKGFISKESSVNKTPKQDGLQSGDSVHAAGVNTHQTLALSDKSLTENIYSTRHGHFNKEKRMHGKEVSNDDCTMYPLYEKVKYVKSQNTIKDEIAIKSTHEESGDKSSRSPSVQGSTGKRYVQKRRFSRSQRDRRSSLHRIRMAQENEDDEYMRIQQQLNTLGKYSKKKSQDNQASTDAAPVLQLPKSIWNRNIRNAIYGTNLRYSSDGNETSSDEDSDCRQGLRGDNDRASSIPNGHNVDIVVTKAESESDSTETDTESEYTQPDFPEPAYSKGNGMSRISSNRLHPDMCESRFSNVDKCDSGQYSVGKTYGKCPVKDTENISCKSDAAFETVKSRSSNTTNKGPNFDIPARKPVTTQREQQEESDNEDTCLELESNDEDSNRLSWRSRGYTYDFFMSRQSRTGAEIMEQVQQTRSNRSSRRTTPSSSAESSRKSSYTGRTGVTTAARPGAGYSKKPQRLYKTLNNLGEDDCLPSTENRDTSKPRSTKHERLNRENSDGDIGLNVEKLKAALERAAKCTTRMDQRLAFQLK